LPNVDNSVNYYQEYCKLFVANVMLTNQLKELINEKNDLTLRLQMLEKKHSISEPSMHMSKHQQ